MVVRVWERAARALLLLQVAALLGGPASLASAVSLDSGECQDGLPGIVGAPGLKGQKGEMGLMGYVGQPGFPGEPGRACVLDQPLTGLGSSRVLSALVFQDKQELLNHREDTAPGTLAYVTSESKLAVKLAPGWRYVTLGGELKQDEPFPGLSYFKTSNES